MSPSGCSLGPRAPERFITPNQTRSEIGFHLAPFTHAANPAQIIKNHYFRQSTQPKTRNAPTHANANASEALIGLAYGVNPVA